MSKNDNSKLMMPNINKNIDIPFGDYGCLSREIRKTIDLDNEFSLESYAANIYECVENYIYHFNQCSYNDKKKILLELESYEKHLDNQLYQSFPFKEWLQHPIQGNIHSGASFGWTNLIIRDYLLRPEELKSKWYNIISKYFI